MIPNPPYSPGLPSNRGYLSPVQCDTLHMPNLGDCTNYAGTQQSGRREIIHGHGHSQEVVQREKQVLNSRMSNTLPTLPILLDHSSPSLRQQSPELSSLSLVSDEALAVDLDQLSYPQNISETFLDESYPDPPNYHHQEPRPLRPAKFCQSTTIAFNVKARLYSSHFPLEHTLNPYFVQTYELEDELGSGGYGFVMTAHHRLDGHEVAVKFIIKDKVPEHAWMDHKIGRLPTEVMLLSFIDHENIVKCLDLFEDSLYFYLVQELHGSPWQKVERDRPIGKSLPIYSSCASVTPSTPSLSPSASDCSIAGSEPATPPHSPASLHLHPEIHESDKNRYYHVPSTLHIPSPTKPKYYSLQGRPEYSRRPSHDLFECIEQSQYKRLSEDQARYVFTQVVDAVHYLDSHGVTHRDIKDENIVIDRNLKVKLIDFGSAIVVDPTVPRPYYTLFYGTAAYASSEILLKQTYQAPPAEIWTLGVLLSFLLTGTSPFPTVKDAIEGKIILAEGFAKILSAGSMNLMRICLDPNPRTRPTIAEVKAHPWLNSDSL